MNENGYILDEATSKPETNNEILIQFEIIEFARRNLYQESIS